MTHQSVEILIGKLVTDEELREAFEQNPHAVLAWLRYQGLPLSSVEMEALKAINPSELSGLADMIDRRLQKASLRGRQGRQMTRTTHDTATLPTTPPALRSSARRGPMSPSPYRSSSHGSKEEP